MMIHDIMAIMAIACGYHMARAICYVATMYILLLYNATSSMYIEIFYTSDRAFCIAFMLENSHKLVR